MGSSTPKGDPPSFFLLDFKLKTTGQISVCSVCAAYLLPPEPLARDQVDSFVPNKSEDKLVSFAKDQRESQEFIGTI